MSDNAIDTMIDALKGVSLDKVNREVNELREIKKWAVENLGLDYTVGDDVVIVSSEPYSVGGAWDPYKRALAQGEKGRVVSIDFNPVSGRWAALTRFPDPDRKPELPSRGIVFSLDVEWVAKELPEEDPGPAEMALVASELHKAEGKLAFVSECCDIMERGTEPMVPLQQVRNMLEAPHRILAESMGHTDTEGVETPGCDCGHDGMGRSWHTNVCAWKSAGAVRDAGQRFLEVINKALSDWHSDVHETRDTAKNAYMARKVTELHSLLLAEMASTV